MSYTGIRHSLLWTLDDMCNICGAWFLDIRMSTILSVIFQLLTWNSYHPKNSHHSRIIHQPRGDHKNSFPASHGGHLTAYTVYPAYTAEQSYASNPGRLLSESARHTCSTTGGTAINPTANQQPATS